MRNLANKPINARPFSTDMMPNGQVFCDRVEYFEEQNGMSLLEHYAGEVFKVLVGEYFNGSFNISNNENENEDTVMARTAIRYAKTLIAELEKENA